MAIRVFLGALLAAVVMFVWGYVFWGVLPFHKAVFKKLPDEDVLLKELGEKVTQSGTYEIPGKEDPPGGELVPGEVEKEWTEKYRRGPIGWLIWQKSGGEPMDPQLFAQGFAAMFVAALVAGGLLSLAAPSLDSYGRRVLFVAAVGVVTVAASVVSDAIWWRMPWDFQLLKATYQIIGWTLSGVVLAAIIKPERRREF